jgi:AcrR family transcriptional regulator
MFTEQQEKWLKRVDELFLRFGIKSITMDDVARELGISKKTLYQFVESKDDLVQKMLSRHIEQEKNTCKMLFAMAGNALEEMYIVIESDSQQLKQMKANIIHDLQRYHHEAWEKVTEYQRGFLYSVVHNNLERGIREGLYRTDFDVDIVTKLHISGSLQLFNEDIFPHSQYKYEQVFREYMLHYLYGIVSEKGLALLKSKFPS